MSLADELWLKIGGYIEEPKTILNLYIATGKTTQAFADNSLMKKTFISYLIERFSEQGKYHFISPIILGFTTIYSTVKPITQEKVLASKWSIYFSKHDYTLDELKSLYLELNRAGQKMSDVIPAFFEKPYCGAHRLCFETIAALNADYPSLARCLINFAKFNRIDIDTPSSTGQSALSSLLNKWSASQSNSILLSITFLIYHGARTEYLSHYQQNILERIQAIRPKINAKTLTFSS